MVTGIVPEAMMSIAALNFLVHIFSNVKTRTNVCIFPNSVIKTKIVFIVMMNYHVSHTIPFPALCSVSVWLRTLFVIT